MPESIFTEPELPEPTEIEVGGAILELPAGATPDIIKKAVENFRASPEFDNLIDKRSGAPAFARAVVGGAAEKDKLANVKRFFPDAQPHGDDNFVFTDPGTGRPTLFNPPGLDVGDVAGVAREAAQVVGAGLGAAFGAAGGFVVGAPTGPGVLATTPVGAAIGAGLGSAAGGSLFDVSMSLFGGRIETRTFLEVTTGTALDVFGAAVGQRAGELLGAGVKAAIGGAKPLAQRLVQAFNSLGVEKPAGAVTGSKAVGGVTKALEVTPTSADVMQRQAETVLGQVKKAAESLARKFGPVKTPLGAGEDIKAAAQKAAERFGFTQETVYNKAFDLVGADRPVAVGAITELRLTMMEELARAPKALKKALGSALAQLRSIEADAAEGGIAFSALRQVRTGIGQDIARPNLIGGSGAQNAALKRIYGALTEDMSAAAKAAGPEAAKRLAVADRFTRAFMSTAAKTLDKISKFDADERAFNFVMSATKDGVKQLRRLHRQFTNEEFDTIAGTVLGRMGLARPGAQGAAGDTFSVSTFLTNWNRISPEAKKVLFGGARYRDLAPELDNLVRVVSSLKAVEKLTNTSNTAQNLIAFTTLQTLGGALTGFAVGGPDAISGLAGAAGFIIAPRLAAKLITSPAFVKWLTTPITSSTGILAHVGRLAGIAVAEPELREAIDQYTAALRSVPAR